MHHNPSNNRTIFPDFSAFQTTLPTPKAATGSRPTEPLVSEDWAPFWPDYVRVASSVKTAGKEKQASGN
ncbi:hypothetical protein [Arthrobacter sp. M4]|uniref:hypothetical protein n=1 Tax=Arthrobacter sp. M4 TaxID=218160 RepID=UPI001CDC74C1|nr:hypothetical protein [Arthrobacter sp. M4]MCA4134493.1 hypothetical protein [Arthrobacter sp. M4]